MGDYTLGAVESRFADIIWDNEPLSSTELARRAEHLLGWKKSTSFTVLKRLINKGLFQNSNGVVTSVMSKDEFKTLQSEQFIEETFDNSLPAFLAAFTAKKSLSADEVAELRRLIDNCEEDA